jgi:hypothetical protein
MSSLNAGPPQGETSTVSRPSPRPVRLGLGTNVGAAVAAVLFGASVVAVRVAVQDIPPLSLAGLRFGLAALLLNASREFMLHG